MKSLEMQMRSISFLVTWCHYNVIEFYTAVDCWYFNYDVKQIL